MRLLHYVGKLSPGELDLAPFAGMLPCGTPVDAAPAQGQCAECRTIALGHNPNVTVQNLNFFAESDVDFVLCQNSPKIVRPIYRPALFPFFSLFLFRSLMVELFHEADRNKPQGRSPD